MKKNKKGGCCLAPSRDGWDPRPELRDGKVRGVHRLPTLSARDANTNLQRCHELRRSRRNWKIPQKKRGITWWSWCFIPVSKCVQKLRMVI